MSLLFDVSDTEPVRKPRRAQKSEPPVEVKKAPIYIGKTEYLGRLDDHYQCLDQTCQAWAHDIVEEFDGHWLIECCFCGTGQAVPIIRGYLVPKEQEFVFRDGRFEGKTIEDALGDPRGADYVGWAAASHPRKAVREACQKFLDSQKSVV